MSKNIASNTSNKPVIGITTRCSVAGDFYLRREYSEVVAALGGIPFLLPLIPETNFLDSIMLKLDGLLLPGSDSDIDPLLFGQEPSRKLGKVQPLRDETDLLLIEKAEKINLPILGICYGMQALNVARGGTLRQDIESEMPNSIAHQQGDPRDRRSHHVLLAENSFLRMLSKDNKVLVNSHHHQSVASAGENLKITAHALDGVIEAVEDTRDGRFFVGVQWHPELDWKNDDLSQNLFAAFIKTAKKVKDESQ